MAILHSCCFWRTVRKGSYASAIYTLIYFGCSSIMLLKYLREEEEYLMGKIERPTGESLLERGEISPTTVIFNILFLICSLCLVLSSVLVVIGLWKDMRHLLLPWTFFMCADIFIEFSHLLYLVTLQRLIFDPLVSVVLTIDFFIMCLNVYCLLCVISQYQELKSELLNTDVIYYISGNTTSNSMIDLNTFQQDQQAMSPNTNCSTIPEESELNDSIEKDEMIPEGDKESLKTSIVIAKPTSYVIPGVISET